MRLVGMLAVLVMVAGCAKGSESGEPDTAVAVAAAIYIVCVTSVVVVPAAPRTAVTVVAAAAR